MFNKQQKSNEEVNERSKKVLFVSGAIATTAAVAGLTVYIVYKKCNNQSVDSETEMLRDIVLEAGVFDAGISNISRKLDIARCKLDKYIAGGNLDDSKVQFLKDNITKWEKLLAYAIKWKEEMIDIEE